MGGGHAGAGARRGSLGLEARLGAQAGAARAVGRVAHAGRVRRRLGRWLVAVSFLQRWLPAPEAAPRGAEEPAGPGPWALDGLAAQRHRQAPGDNSSALSGPHACLENNYFLSLNL